MHIKINGHDIRIWQSTIGRGLSVNNVFCGHHKSEIAAMEFAVLIIDPKSSAPDFKISA